MAQFAAAAGGEAQASAAVEAALLAAQAADDGRAEVTGDATQRLPAAGRACAAAIRGVLDALGADGTLGV
eukprot:3683870-Pleurochrysis_carterae.AAC.1